MKIFVAQEHAHLIEKLEAVFADEKDIEFEIDRRVGERRRTFRNIYMRQPRSDRRQNQKHIIWAVY